jgi:pimeloyl-ACP methyl ester carboxylesterase/thioester reductase-like protein
MRRVLLAGAPGLVGTQVLAELARRPDVETITLLQAAEPQPGWPRQLVGEARARLRILRGDVGEPRLGLDRVAWERLATAIDTIFDCGDGDPRRGAAGRRRRLAAARNAAVRPLDSWTELLAAQKRLRLHQLSSVLLAGAHRGLFTEFDLECGQELHNPAERRWLEGERLLHASRAAARVTIYRVSHVVGHSRTGAASRFDGAYPLLALLRRGISGLLPGDPLARLDLVPADYVALAMVTLAAEPASAGKTFHLVAGWPKSLPLGELAARIAGAAGRPRRQPRFVPRIAWGPLRAASRLAGGRVLAGFGRSLDACSPYLGQGPVFDDLVTQTALARHGIASPACASYLDAVLRFAEGHRWQAPQAAGGGGSELATLFSSRAAAAAATPTAAAGAAIASAATPATAAAARATRGATQARIGDYNVVYRETGSGAAVVLLHGFAGAASWEPVVERLADHYRCIVVDTLGLGDTTAEPDADYALPAQAAMVRGLIAALGLDAVHLVGNDTGGAIAQLFAVRWPACVRSLVLSDCDAFDNWPSRQVKLLRWLARLPGAMPALGAAMRIPAVARSPLGYRRMVFDKSLLTRERLRAYLRPIGSDRASRQRFRRLLLALDPSCTQDIVHLLRSFARPTLIVWGCEDEYWSTSWAKRLYDEIPGAVGLQLIPWAGISCHEERPEHFAQLLRDFFAYARSGRVLPRAVDPSAPPGLASSEPLTRDGRRLYVR